MSPRVCLILAGFLGAMAVAVGAYHAHGMKKSLVEQQLSPEEVDKRMANTAVAVNYQMIHALGLVAVASLLLRKRCVPLIVTAWLFLGGQLLFCGMLYSLSFTGYSPHWSLVPLGGLLFIAGWISLAAAGFTVGAPEAKEVKK